MPLKMRPRRGIKTSHILNKDGNSTLLFLNAACILHEERFLMKYGWGANQNIQGFGEPPTIKSQILNLLRSIRTVMRIPLIFINIITIFIKLLLG